MLIRMTMLKTWILSIILTSFIMFTMHAKSKQFFVDQKKKGGYIKEVKKEGGKEGGELGSSHSSTWYYQYVLFSKKIY